MRKTIKKVTQKYHDSVVEGLTQTIDRLNEEREKLETKLKDANDSIASYKDLFNDRGDKMVAQSRIISELEGRNKEKEDARSKAIGIALNTISQIPADEDRCTVFQRAIGAVQAALLTTHDHPFGVELNTFENRTMMHMHDAEVKSDLGYVDQTVGYAETPYKNKMNIRSGKY